VIRVTFWSLSGLSLFGTNGFDPVHDSSVHGAAGFGHGGGSSRLYAAIAAMDLGAGRGGE
jgi:hypothetical protein